MTATEKDNEGYTDQLNEYLLNLLNTKPEDIKCKDDMKRFNFKCPQRGQIEPATELVLLTNILNEPLNTPVDEITKTNDMSKVGVCCKDCWRKMKTDETK